LEVPVHCHYEVSGDSFWYQILPATSGVNSKLFQNGVTPLHVASHYDHQNVALLLLDKGASPHATAKNGHTPLHIAARKNQVHF
jgi:ankyrin repeat protein